MTLVCLAVMTLLSPASAETKKSSGKTATASAAGARTSSSKSSMSTAKKSSAPASATKKSGSASPTKAAAPPPAPPAEPVPAETGSASPEELEAVHAELVSLRAELAALRADLVPPPPPEPEAPLPSPEEVAREARRAELHAELADVAAQRDRLSAVVAGGVDPAFVASGLSLLDQRESDAIASLASLDVAPAVETAVEAAPPAAAPKLGLSLDAGLATAYAFRGLNTFQSRSQQDVAALFAPSASVSFGDSGVTVGWWGGFQVSGDHATELVDAGYGAEQDLFVGYSATVAENLKVGGAFTGFVYPFATEAAAGTAVPLYLEPSASVSWSPGVDLGLQVAYTFGVQDALSAARYVYVHPTVGKTVPLPAGLSVAAAVGGGWKGYGEGGPTDNVWDVSADLAIQKDFDGGFYLRPGAHAVWTNVEGASFSESSFAWFGVNAGAVL